MREMVGRGRRSIRSLQQLGTVPQSFMTLLGAQAGSECWSSAVLRGVAQRLLESHGTPNHSRLSEAN